MFIHAPIAEHRSDHGASSAPMHHRPTPLLALLLLAICLPIPGNEPGAPRDLTLRQRIDAQRVIERVYYAHQEGATLPFEEAVTEDLLVSRVRHYLKLTTALEEIWKTPVSAAMLEAEMARIARDSRLPDRLGEIRHALDDDLFLMQECFVRPILVERLARSFFASDERFHPPGEVGKTTWEAWWAEAENNLDEQSVHAVSTGGRVSPQVRREVSSVISSCAMDDTWNNGLLDDGPEARGGGREAVWTGSVMIVWGGSYLNSLIYDPLTDTWRVTSPLLTAEQRNEATAVWTGREMIVWGGVGLNSGWKYDPAADSWAPTSTAGAPSGRRWHTAIWTGSRMIVWGGSTNVGGGAYTDSGGIYDPETDTWASTTPTGAPAARVKHSAVWTGTRMIVWGGSAGSGGIYDPVMDAWAPMSTLNAPWAPASHTAVWTGTEMLVWGGYPDYNADVHSVSGRYDPAADRWRAMSTTGEPEPRLEPAAVWTGSRMLVWGGEFPGWGYSDTGGSYDPSTDTWTPMSVVNPPRERSRFPGIWTGSLMLVWGGTRINSGGGYLGGGRYDPESDSWTPISTRASGPEPRSRHTAVWTGTRMIVWGGSRLASGGIYDPMTDSWTPTALDDAPAGRTAHAAVWTGREMIVWGGGAGAADLATGGRYDPIANRWVPTSLAGAPSARSGPRAVWTGNRMLVWGGLAGASFLETGARYDPLNDTWEPMTGDGAPGPRAYHTAIWTGREMIVWGGRTHGWYGSDDGGRYDPVLDLWRPVTTSGAPSPRYDHTAVWSGDEMIVWGGHNDACCGSYDTGGRYRPATDTWIPTDTVTAPVSRRGHTAVWTGRFMLVWGGSHDPAARLETGGRYDPVADTWQATSLWWAPGRRADHTAVWTGAEMIVWGGLWGLDLNTGGRYTVMDDRDQDEDGFRICDGDCDDANPAVHPAAVEVPGNGIDEDCDAVLACDPAASWTRHGDYVSCVSRACDALVSNGSLAGDRCEELVGAAARSRTGLRDQARP